MEAIDWKTLTPEQRNAVVAEKIFDRKAEPCTGRFVPADYVGSGRQLCISCGAKYTYPGPMAHNSLPPPDYSTDIGAAWLIVVKMRDKYSGWWIINVSFDTMLPNVVTLTTEKSYTGDHTSVVEAICIAALRAVGCEVEV